MHHHYHLLPRRFKHVDVVATTIVSCIVYLLVSIVVRQIEYFFSEDHPDFDYKGKMINELSKFERDNSWSNDHTEVRHTLVWSYFRSGSTFLGELLSAQAPSVFIYEPLRYVPFLNASMQALYLKALFHCHPFVFSFYLKMFLVSLSPPTLGECQRAKHVVIKVNRIMEAEPFIHMTEGNYIKIVHLVRDPRSTLYSRQRLHLRGMHTKVPEVHCRLVEANLAALTTLPLNKYYLVKYEDLVEKPKHLAKKMYEFLGIIYGYDVEGYIENHTTQHSKSFYETFRKTRLMDLYRWKKDLTEGERAHYQDVCRLVLIAFNYELL